MNQGLEQEILRGLELAVRSRMKERKEDIRKMIIDDFERVWAEESGRIAVVLSRMVSFRMNGMDTLEITVRREPTEKDRERPEGGV